MAADVALQLRPVVFPDGAVLSQKVQYIGHKGEYAVRVKEVQRERPGLEMNGEPV